MNSADKHSHSARQGAQIMQKAKIQNSKSRTAKRAYITK